MLVSIISGVTMKTTCAMLTSDAGICNSRRDYEERQRLMVAYEGTLSSQTIVRTNACGRSTHAPMSWHQHRQVGVCVSHMSIGSSFYPATLFNCIGEIPQDLARGFHREACRRSTQALTTFLQPNVALVIG